MFCTVPKAQPMHGLMGQFQHLEDGRVQQGASWETVGQWKYVPLSVNLTNYEAVTQNTHFTEFTA